MNKVLETAMILMLINVSKDKPITSSEISKETMNKHFTVHELELLDDVVEDYNKLDKEGKRSFLVMMTFMIEELIDEDIDKANTMANIAMKLTLIKMVAGTVLIGGLATLAHTLITGDNMFSSYMSDMWAVIESMFFK